MAFTCCDGLVFSPQWQVSHIDLFKSVECFRVAVEYGSAAVLCELHVFTLALRMPLYGGHYGRILGFEKKKKNSST